MISSFCKHPKRSLIYFFDRHFHIISDKTFLCEQYEDYMGEKPNLENPQKFTEKLLWMKLYGRNPIYTQMVDKYEVKKYVEEHIGQKYVVPAYGVWHSFDEIDFSQLPDQFILKCNHDSGSYVICKDRKTFDKKNAHKILDAALKKNFFWKFREWVYKNVDRRILAEQYIPTLGQKNSVEYKLMCFDGEVKTITVCSGIPHQVSAPWNFDNYSRDWKRQNWYGNSNKPLGKDFKRPKEMDEIIALSEKLSKGIPHVRIDWYITNGQIYFGEFTFYPWAGYIKFEPKEWNLKVGEWMKLPDKHE